MDSNKNRVELRKSEIIKNMNLKGDSEIKAEKIYISEFRERLEKGEKFITPQQVDNFNMDVKELILKAYTPEEKELIKQKADKDLSLLKAVDVVSENGKVVSFFSIIEKQ